MPVIPCPVCRFVATLPDPWHHSGFTCTNCYSSVAIAAPLLPVEQAPAFGLDDESQAAPRTVNYRNRTRAGDAMAQGFGGAFGDTLGRFVAGCLIVGFLGACLVVFVFAMSHK